MAVSDLPPGVVSKELSSERLSTEPSRQDALSWEEAIAYRKATQALRMGRTEFIALPEPLLAFHRIHEDQTITCVFNLSKDAQSVVVNGRGALDGPAHATLSDTALHLPGNGYAYITHTGPLTLKEV